jgi:hypothetical protein
MNIVDREKWARRRSKGMLLFVFIDGGLKFGGSLLVAFFLVQLLLTQRNITINSIISDSVVCFIAGLIFGLVIWLINEMRFN